MLFPRRASRKYWEELKPATGRAFSAAFSIPDNWGVTAGAPVLTQQAEATTAEEVQKLQQYKKD